MIGCLSLLLTLPLAMWEAWVVGTLWGWFVTPAFGIGVPAFWHIVGMLVLIGVVKTKSTDIRREDVDADDADLFSMFRQVIVGVLMPLTGLAWGALIHWIAI